MAYRAELVRRFNALPVEANTVPEDSCFESAYHLRHVGGGLLQLYKDDEMVRDIGTTPDWNFKDRDEVISRYNHFCSRRRLWS